MDGRTDGRADGRAGERAGWWAGGRVGEQGGSCPLILLGDPSKDYKGISCPALGGGTQGSRLIQFKKGH